MTISVRQVASSRARAWEPAQGVWLVSFLLCLLLTPVGASAGTFAGNAADQVVSLQALHDPSGSLTIDDVLKPDIAAGFAEVRRASSWGLVSGAVWMRVLLAASPDKAQTVWFDVNLATLGEAQLFQLSDHGYVARQKVGADHHFALRELPYRSPLYRLDLPAGSTQTLYLRMRSNSSLVIDPRLWTPAGFLQYYAIEQQMAGIYIAVHVLVMLGSLWFGLYRRDRIHMLLAAFVFCSLGLTLATEGLIFKHVVPDMPGSTSRLMFLFWLACLPLGASIIIDLLGRSVVSGRSRRGYLRALWGVSLVVGGITVIQPSRGTLVFYQLWTMAHVTLMLVLVSRRAMAGQREARALLWAVTPLFAGLLVRFGRNVGWLPANEWSNLAYSWGFIGCLVMAYVAAFKRYQQAMDDRVRLQDDALRQTRASEQRLELLVADRTAALNQTLQRLQQSLRLEQRAREDQQRFFATVSHELRTPLAVIDATAVNLQSDLPQDDEAGRKRCGRIRLAVSQLAHLASDSFQEDRFRSLQRGVIREAVAVEALLRDASEAGHVLSPDHVLRVDAGSAPAMAWCDRELTRLALRNLVSNAIKYSPAGTEVQIVARAMDDGLQLEVVDDGPGAPPEDLDQLCRSYYRGRNTAGIPGTGLGLSLAKEMIEAQGGALTLANQPGKGLSASIFLPATGLPSAG